MTRVKQNRLVMQLPLFVALFAGAMAPSTRAADQNPSAESGTTSARSALSPQESLKQIVVDPGLRVELVAHEPNVIDPVAIRFDEDGRLWVVEMRDYPTGPDKEFPARSRISLLADKDGDGFFETATVFADKLPFATGLQPWLGGVIVTLGGKVAYLKDTNGDGRADINETWYTGFAQGNQQLRANHPTLALDGHIYIASGLRGGTIVDVLHPSAEHVPLSGMDFRFDPRTHKFESITGNAQFGLTFDDYGNRFVCSNRDPAIHVVLENEQLKKNPLVTVDSVVEHVVQGADATPVHPIGRAWTTSNLHAGQFTAACGLAIYRGDALPTSYYGNAFTCEPTGYLVHRERLKPSGVTFAASGEKQSTEFFASRDEWCRPVNLETGPDGGLYVVDMYRQIIEHPEWMPKELRDRPNLRAGNDRGRIYRIVAADFRRPQPPRLSTKSSSELVDLLASPNGWWRDTAFRLLVERGDLTVAKKLRAIALEHDSPLARVDALRVLEWMSSVDDDLLLKLCDDPNPRIVEQAIVVAEPRIATATALRERISRLAVHDDARVRFAALLTALPTPPSPKHPADRWEQTAILIATGNYGGTVLKQLLTDRHALKSNISDPTSFVIRLARLAAASPNESERTAAIEAVLADADFTCTGLTDILAETGRRGIDVSQLRERLPERTRQLLDQALAAARHDATDVQQTEGIRRSAIELLACLDDPSSILLPLALHDSNQNVRVESIAALGRCLDSALWQELVKTIPRETPAIQRAILDGVLANSDRIGILFDAIAAGSIKPMAIDPVQAKQLLAHKDAAIRERAQKVLAAAIPADREKVLADYRTCLELKADAAHGRAVFEKRCSVCHRISDVGVKFAPDISDSRERTPLQLLTDILQPNRAIDSNFFSFTVVTKDGRTHTGVLASETSTSVTLRQQENKTEVLSRGEIEELNSNGVSYMPEGLEKDISKQEMADLISFIKNWRYLENPQEYAPK